MIPSTDFDRLLTSWLEAAGPADLGRETVDAALQAARGRRQRRGLLAWLVGPGSWPAYGARRGFTALPAILRIALLVGLVLALLGGTLYVGGRVLRPAAALPLGAWVGRMPDNLSFGAPSGPTTMTLVVGPTTRVRLSSPPEAVVFDSSMTVVADHQVRLVITSVTPLFRGLEPGTPVAIDGLWLAGCKLGDVGLYTWSISADGALLTVASDGEACPSREAVLARTWNAHEIPFGGWVAVKPDNLSFGSVWAAGGRIELGLGEFAAVGLTVAVPPGFDWFNSTVTRAGDYWEFTSKAEAGPTTPVSVDGRVLAGCNPGDVGRYVPSLSADGSELTLASAGDACPSREAVLARTWGYRAPPQITGGE